jgi:hypothetical protein
MMKRLPNRYIKFLLPLSTRVACGQLTPTEELALLWLWDWPLLLGWARPIIWLGHRIEARRSGVRLWGVDSIATLIIVEIKIDRGKAPDPFESLVFEVESSSTKFKCPADSLPEEWRKWITENANPVLFGVVASVRSRFSLSPKARRNLQQLQKRVGDERVLLRVMNATLESQELRVRQRSPG